MDEREKLEKAIASLEKQRSTLGDEVVDAALAPMREKLKALNKDIPEEQRKQITILFADVSGFTAMSEKMDAEEVRNVMNALWEKIDTAITENNGYIDKHIGDAVMGLWGAKTAEEDDPEKAVRAALCIQTIISEFKKTNDYSISMHIGINTGPVILGDVGKTGEYTAMGDAVNLASRLEHAAPKNGILISHDTYRHIRGLFDAVPQKPLKVKGKKEPVKSYIIEKAKKRSFRMTSRGIEGIETEMKGRDAELLILRNLYRDSMEDTSINIATIVGEAGVGKSRLLYEFSNWIELLPEKIFLIQGRATPEMKESTYGIIRSMFSFRFEISDSDDKETVMRKFRAGMSGVLNENEADHVGHLIGFDFSSSRTIQNLLGSDSFKELGLSYITKYMRSIAKQPAVVLLEDIQFADESSLDLISHLVQKIRDGFLMFVCLTRPVLFERRPHWGEGLLCHTRIDLKPLSPRMCKQLVKEILQKIDTIPEVLLNLLSESSEGNPFYLEEIIKMLFDSRIITRDGEKWTITADSLPDFQVPSTLTGVLQARLDSLQEDEKTVLQRASIVGRIFWDEAVANLRRENSEEKCNKNLMQILTNLRQKEFIFLREKSGFRGTEEYIFKHAMLRDVTYETVLLRDRRNYHRQAAEWLESKTAERIAEYFILIAGHYESAGEYLKVSNFLGKAGDALLQKSAFTEAVKVFSKASDLLPDNCIKESIYLRVKLAESYRRMGEFVKAIDLFKLILAKSEDSTNPETEAFVLSNLGWTETKVGSYGDAELHCRKAIEIAQKSNLKKSTAEALNSRGWLAYFQGSYADTKKYAKESLRIAEEVDDRRIISSALTLAGAAETIATNYAEAFKYNEASIEIGRELGDKDIIARGLNNLGDCAILEKHYQDALMFLSECIVTAREIGNKNLEVIGLKNLGNAHLGLQQFNQALDSYRGSIKVAQSINMVPMLLACVNGIAGVFSRTGQISRAAEYIGLTSNHPVQDYENREEIERILAYIKEHISESELEEAMIRGKKMKLKNVVNDILESQDSEI